MTNIEKNDAALANVAAHGIAVRRATGDPATGTHAAMIRVELTARCPAGMGSYVLWATSGDAYALHCSDAGVAEAVAAACHAGGVETHRDGRRRHRPRDRAVRPRRRRGLTLALLGARGTASPARLAD